LRAPYPNAQPSPNTLRSDFLASWKLISRGPVAYVISKQIHLPKSMIAQRQHLFVPVSLIPDRIEEVLVTQWIDCDSPIPNYFPVHRSIRHGSLPPTHYPERRLTKKHITVERRRHTSLTSVCSSNSVFGHSPCLEWIARPQMPIKVCTFFSS
jgi:hypothetical protein